MKMDLKPSNINKMKNKKWQKKFLKFPNCGFKGVMVSLFDR